VVKGEGKLSARQCINEAIGGINKKFVPAVEEFVKPRKVLVLGSGGKFLPKIQESFFIDSSHLK
jgi:hypothetical protein